MKRDTLFEHKEFAVTCEEIMADGEEYRKLLEPPKKLKKALDNIWIENMCDFYHKLGHLKERCHWNPENPKNKLKDKKKVLVNEVSSQAGKGMSGNHEKKVIEIRKVLRSTVASYEPFKHKKLQIDSNDGD